MHSCSPLNSNGNGLLLRMNPIIPSFALLFGPCPVTLIVQHVFHAFFVVHVVPETSSLVLSMLLIWMWM